MEYVIICYVIKRLKQSIYETGNMIPDIKSVKGWEKSGKEQEKSKKQLPHSESNPNVYIP